MKIIKKSLIIVEIIFLLFVFVGMLCDFMLGIDNHDVYYLVLTIIDYEILKLIIKDVKNDIDNL